MSATWRLLPRIEVMMFRPVVLVKRPWIWASVNCEEGSVHEGRIGWRWAATGEARFPLRRSGARRCPRPGPRRRLGELTLVGHVDFKATISALADRSGMAWPHVSIGTRQGAAGGIQETTISATRAARPASGLRNSQRLTMSSRMPGPP